MGSLGATIQGLSKAFGLKGSIRLLTFWSFRVQGFGSLELGQ